MGHMDNQEIENIAADLAHQYVVQKGSVHALQEACKETLFHITRANYWEKMARELMDKQSSGYIRRGPVKVAKEPRIDDVPNPLTDDWITSGKE